MLLGYARLESENQDVWRENSKDDPIENIGLMYFPLSSDIRFLGKVKVSIS